MRARIPRTRVIALVSTRALATILLLLSATATAEAQWRTQDVSLQPGWNAVFLEVQPEPAEPATVFAGIPVDSVWMWNREFSSVQFVQDAATLVPEQQDWLHYLPNKEPFLSNLFAIQGGQAFLIRLGGSTPVTWHVTGRPLVRPVDWLADSFNLVGLHVNGASPPSFATYFAASPAHLAGPVYRLSQAGVWEALSNLATETIRPGVAYWVYCKGSSTFPGPLRVALEQAGTVDFGRVLTDQIVRIENRSLTARQIDVRAATSAAPPAGSAALAGVVPLSYWSGSARRYLPLTAPLTLSIGAGKEIALRLAVRRPDMTPSGDAAARYQTLLQVNDGAGTQLVVPVVARGPNSLSESALSGSRGVAAEVVPSKFAGLWVGSATVDRVNEAANPGDKTTPRPTGSEMQIRLIVHVDDGGSVRLLQQVMVLYKDGTTKPDPNDPSKSIVDQPGHFVLVTDDAQVPNFSGSTLRNGQLVGRRISSAAFAFKDPVTLNGGFGGALVSAPITLDYDDPLNPFKHKFHPDHDNLDYDFTHVLEAGRESYTITRTVKLAFAAEDPEGLQTPGWGDTQVGGTYLEDLTGLHREPLHVAGLFRLHHVSRIGVLNQ